MYLALIWFSLCWALCIFTRVFFLWLAEKCCIFNHITTQFGKHLKRALLIRAFSVVQSDVGCFQAFAERWVVLSVIFECMRQCWKYLRLCRHKVISPCWSSYKALPTRPSVNGHDDRTLSSGARLCVRMPPTCLQVCIHGWSVDITGAAFFSLIKKHVSVTHYTVLCWHTLCYNKLERMCDCVHSLETLLLLFIFLPFHTWIIMLFNFRIKHVYKCLNLKFSLDQSEP